jgi:(R,R)-butanediol dehydrogenase/meso-butanediol dehydrogenase/diacetyl reductase
MRAAVFHGVGRRLEIEERQRPAAAPGGIVVRVAYAGICGSDLHATEASLVPLEPGTVLGHEFAGEVVDSAVPEWRAGDRVIGVPLRECEACRPAGECRKGLGILCQENRIVGMSEAVPGAYAEYVALGARHALRVPEGIGLRAAALAEPLAVGAHAVRLAGSLYGRDVLVVGAGPIGLAVVAFARFAGARRITVSEIDPVRRARAGTFGATALLDPGAERLGDALARAGIAAPEVVFECVGVKGLIQDCIALAPVRGRIVVVGVNRGEDVIVPRMAIRKELSVQFVLGYQHEDFALVLELMAQGRLDGEALVTRVIGLDELPETFERLRRPGPDGKVLIDPSR